MPDKNVTEPEVEFDPATGFVKEIAEELGPGDAPMAVGEDANLDQVREILIGAQSRRLEQKLEGLAQNVQQSVADVTEETRTRIDKIEHDIKKQLTELLEAVRSHREERKTVIEDLRAEVASRHEGFDKALADLSDKASDLRGTIKAVTQRTDALAKKLTSQSEKLRVELVDRASFSSLLGELADRVNDPLAVAIKAPAGHESKRAVKSK